MASTRFYFADQPALGGSDLLFPPSWVGHVPFGRWVVAATKPGLVVELGTHTGVSLFALANGARDARHACRIVAIDHWQGEEHAGFFDASVLETLRGQVEQAFPGRAEGADDGPSVELMQRTFDEALPEFNDGTVDLLHIDGLHTYEAVRHDFETWLPKLSPRGVVLMHDTHVFERGFGVHHFFAELGERYPTFAFSHSHGLGVVLTGAEAPSAMRRVVAGKADTAGLTAQDVFGRLGEGLMAAARLRMVQEEVDRLAGLNARWLRFHREQAAFVAEHDTAGYQPDTAPNETEAQILASGLFDAAFYRAGAGLADSQAIVLLRHYLAIGEARGLRPSLRFDPQHYRRTYPDVVEAGTPLLMHFIQNGRDENRQPLPPAEPAAA